MNKLTGLKDVDREVLKHVDDRDLLQFCSVDRRFWNEVCDDNFLRRRLLTKYPGIEKYKYNESWKQFFLRAIHRIAKMKERFRFEYKVGDFEMQYFTLKRFRYSSFDSLLVEAAKVGELSLVIHALEKGANIHINDEEPLYYAIGNGHVDIVKYLIEKGANFRNMLSVPYLNNLNVLKYLVQIGVPVNTVWLKDAINSKNLDLVRYIVEKGVEIDEDHILLARKYKMSDIENYLLRAKK